MAGTAGDLIDAFPARDDLRVVRRPLLRGKPGAGRSLGRRRCLRPRRGRETDDRHGDHVHGTRAGPATDGMHVSPNWNTLPRGEAGA